MAMSKKDYEAIAGAIKIWTTEYAKRANNDTHQMTWEVNAQKVAEYQLSAVEFLTNEIESVLRKNNPRFDQGTFFKACTPDLR